MAVDTDMILTVGRFIPDAGAPEGRTVRMEDYLAALSRELESLYIRMNDLLRDLEGRTAALESASRSAAQSAARSAAQSAAQSAARSAAATGGETV
ncbi:MAG: hypothetical protein SOZ03_05190 [Eubacteriales bacterium]|nr:hypothetical protein [Eubacteriales bacterium]